MSWIKEIKQIRAQYDKELLKQTEPYEYYLTYEHDELKGEHENVPFSCSELKKETIGGRHYRVYDCDDFLVYEDENGYSSDGERAYLVSEARKLNADFAFSDIDFVDVKNKKHAVFYKPGYGKDTYESFKYESDFYAVRKELNNTPLSNLNNIAHVTKVLYHSFCGRDEKIQSVIEYINERYKNNFITPDYYADNSITDEIVTVIIPSKDNPDRLQTCLVGIKNAKIKSKFNKINAIIVDNGSSKDNRCNITNVIENICADGGLSVKYIYEPEEFNFSKMCNTGAGLSDADYFLFMNDDIEITDDDFIVKLLYYARRPDVGAVGCKLLYPDGHTIQHVGITDLKYAGPSHKLSTYDDNKCLYFGRNLGVHNCLAVTGACLMVSSEKFFKISGFCDKMKVGYNDVDLCVSLYENGCHNIVNNDLKLIHHESVTRGSDAESVDKLKRLKEERDLLYERHPFLKKECDPYYNPNLAGDFLDYRINVIPDHELRSYRSHPLNLKPTDRHQRTAPDMQIPFGSHAPGKASKNFFCNIEAVEVKIDPEFLTEYVEITGWALKNKKDNAFYDIFLIIYGVNAETTTSKDDTPARGTQDSLIANISGDESVSSLSGVRYLSEPSVCKQAGPSLTVPAIAFSTAPVYRSDLQTVFPEAKNVELSGFLARIDLNTLNITSGDVSNLRFGVILKNKLTGKTFYGQCE